MEVYINDMLVKSKERQDHAKHFQEAFELLRLYGMKLNPSKCAFRVNAGMFLGFMVTERGIEANPAQLKAIIETAAPSSRKGVQQLTGRLVALGRFISRFTNRLKSFFVTLKGATVPARMKNVINPSLQLNGTLQNHLSLLAPKPEKHFSSTW